MIHPLTHTQRKGICYQSFFLLYSRTHSAYEDRLKKKKKNCLVFRHSLPELALKQSWNVGSGPRSQQLHWVTGSSEDIATQPYPLDSACSELQWFLPSIQEFCVICSHRGPRPPVPVSTPTTTIAQMTKLLPAERKWQGGLRAALQWMAWPSPVSGLHMSRF